MLVFSQTSLSFLFSVVRLSQAVSLASHPGSRVLRTRSDSPGVIDARNGQLEIANKVIAPDGFQRSATLAGGTFPGPIITAQKGDDFAITVTNNLDDPTMERSTTVHWHGIFQNRSSWADGVSFITQCPIEPGQSFQYRFNAQNQTGTYWYHSHHELQYCDGLRGPLIIYDPHDPHAGLYDVDDASTVITVADWWHKVAPTIARPYVPDATTINGKGRYSGGPKTPLSVINVEKGKRYRFRIISASCDAWHNITMDGHRMTIIEVDGVEVVPRQVDWLQVLPGQRYSVVVTANQLTDNYWIRAFPSNGNQTFIDGLNSAILRYAGAPIRDPTTKQGQATAHFDESGLHPLDGLAAPGVPELGKADVVITLVPGFDNATSTFSLNGATFKPPPAPVLLQMLSGARHPTELLPMGSVYELPKNKVIEVHMPANDLVLGGPHGIHIHGHNFHVIRSSTNSTPNFINPLRRDTVSMGSGAQKSNITIRFVTDNPGPWILHCHVDFHLSKGFAVVMAEAPDVATAQQKNVAPSAWSELCPTRVREAVALFNTTGKFNLAAFNPSSTSASLGTVSSAMALAAAVTPGAPSAVVATRGTASAVVTTPGTASAVVATPGTPSVVVTGTALTVVATPGTPSVVVTTPGTALTVVATPGTPSVVVTTPGTPLTVVATPGTPSVVVTTPGTPLAVVATPGTPSAVVATPGTALAMAVTPGTPSSGTATPATASSATVSSATNSRNVSTTSSYTDISTMPATYSTLAESLL